MFTQFLANHIAQPPPEEGALYKQLTVFGKTFEIRYGYYEDYERQHHEPMAIYPDFLKNPEFTPEGDPYVTAMQDICRNYDGDSQGDTCGECRYFQKGEDLIGICTCLRQKRGIDPESL